MLLRGATLLDLDPPGVEGADLRIEDGRITGRGALDRRPGEAVEDLAGAWVLPGLVCAHTHLYSALACGMPVPAEPPRDFPDLLRKVWWRLDRALDAESIEVSALVGGVAALRAGVTTLVDHHASPECIGGSLERIDSALGELGLRRVLCYEVTDRNGREGARAGLAAHERLLGQDGGGMRAVMVGAHANFTLSDETLGACVGLAKQAGVGLHLHLAEAPEDARLSGGPLVDRLERLGALLPGSLFAHCVHLSRDELDRIAAAGGWVSHQPRSNMNNAVGHAPLRHFGRNTALGTDGIGADMLAELQAGFFRANEAGDGWSPARWTEALAAGARFASERLGVALGRLAPGYAADLVVLDPPPGPPLVDLPAALVFRLSAAAVRHVMVAGTWRLRDRQPVGVDVVALGRRAERVARELWERME